MASVKKTHEHMQMEQSHVYAELYLKDWTVSPKYKFINFSELVESMKRHIERVQEKRAGIHFTMTQWSPILLVEGGWEEMRKPEMVEEYNRYMGGVDNSNQLLSYYGFSHRTVKWWHHAFFYLLDLSVTNAYITCTKVQKPQHDTSYRCVAVYYTSCWQFAILGTV